MKDKALNVLGDRFKIEFIAKEAASRGAADVHDVIKLLNEVAMQSQYLYPKMPFIDGVYKALRSHPQFARTE